MLHLDHLTHLLKKGRRIVTERIKKERKRKKSKRKVKPRTHSPPPPPPLVFPTFTTLTTSYSWGPQPQPQPQPQTADRPIYDNSHYYNINPFSPIPRLGNLHFSGHSHPSLNKAHPIPGETWPRLRRHTCALSSPCQAVSCAMCWLHVCSM
jgi:hypothetical protein